MLAGRYRLWRFVIQVRLILEACILSCPNHLPSRCSSSLLARLSSSNTEGKPDQCNGQSIQNCRSARGIIPIWLRLRIRYINLDNREISRANYPLNLKLQIVLYARTPFHNRNRCKKSREQNHASVSILNSLQTQFKPRVRMTGFSLCLAKIRPSCYTDEVAKTVYSRFRFARSKVAQQ